MPGKKGGGTLPGVTSQKRWDTISRAEIEIRERVVFIERNGKSHPILIFSSRFQVTFCDGDMKTWCDGFFSHHSVMEAWQQGAAQDRKRNQF